MREILQAACTDKERGLGLSPDQLTEAAADGLIAHAQGDARIALGASSATGAANRNEGGATLIFTAARLTLALEGCVVFPRSLSVGRPFPS